MRSEPPRREQLVSDEYVMRPPHSCHGPYHLFGDLVEQESLVKEPLVSSEDVVSPGPPDEGVMSSGPSSSSDDDDLDDDDLVAEDSSNVLENGGSKLQVKFASVSRTLFKQPAFIVYDISLSCCISALAP